jgi:hypothetical protein
MPYCILYLLIVLYGSNSSELNLLITPMEDSKRRMQSPEPVFLYFYKAQESIPRNRSIPPAYVVWRAGTTNLFLLGS